MSSAQQSSARGVLFDAVDVLFFLFRQVDPLSCDFLGESCVPPVFLPDGTSPPTIAIDAILINGKGALFCVYFHLDRNWNLYPTDKLIRLVFCILFTEISLSYLY